MAIHFHAALVTASLLALMGEAHAQQVVTIRNQKSGLALTAQGQAVIQSPFQNGNPGQRWRLTLIPNTSPQQYQFVNLNPGTVQTAMTIERGDERTPVSLTIPSPDQANQRWILIPSGAHFSISPAQHNRRMLDVPGGVATPIHIQISKPNNTDNQRWLLDVIQ